MNREQQILDFVKAMSDPDRLRIIGLLAQSRADRDQIAARLQLPLRDVVSHLAYLEHVGALGLNNGVYELKSRELQGLARSQLAKARSAYRPDPDLDEKTRRIRMAYLNADGSIKQLPAQQGKLRVILEYLVQAFTLGTNYTEKEVNLILKRFHNDTSSLRRNLIDAGLLARESDGSRYWRPA